MGDDPSLVTVQIAIALLAVIVSGGLAALAWRQPRQQRAIGISLVALGAVALPLAGLVGLLPVLGGAAVLAARARASR
jgi:hypothetical protein